MRKTTAGLLTAATIVAAGALAAGPASASGAVHGCPYGAVCVYPQNAGWNGNSPSLEYWSYGAHNLSNQVGNHVVLNNQYPTGGSGWTEAGLDTGYNGTGSETMVLAPYDKAPGQGESWATVNLTPINSIVLFVVGP